MVFAGNPLNLIGQVTQTLANGVPTELTFPLISVGVYVRPRHARISVEGSPVRWGLAPTAISGQYIGITPPNNTLVLEDTINDYTGLLQQVQFIALGGSATLQVNYMD